MTTHPPDELFEEMAFIAYYFNWPREEVLSMPHWERRRWCEEISTINEEVSSPGEDDLLEPTIENLPL